MIDGYSIQDRIPFISAFFIGHDDIFVIIEVGCSHQDKSNDTADRNVAVVSSLLIHFKEFRIHCSGHEQSRCSDASSDNLMEIIILAESGGVKRHIQLLDRFYAYQAIFASTDGDHRDLRLRCKLFVRGFRSSRYEINQSLG